MEVLEVVGCSPVISVEHVRIITGSGYLIAPKVRVIWFQCLGQRNEQMAVVAHTLPIGSFVDGLRRMDFLRPLRARLFITDGVIAIPA
jgi:hypothetical protein